MKKYLFGQLRFERNFYGDIYLVEAGEMSYICSVPITLFSKTIDLVEDILENLTQRFGKIRVRPSRLDDIPKQLRRYFVSIDSDDYFALFIHNSISLEEDDEKGYAYK